MFIRVFIHSSISHIFTICYIELNKSRSQITGQTRNVSFALKLVRLATNRTNQGLFSSDFSMFWLGEPI